MKADTKGPWQAYVMTKFEGDERHYAVGSPGNFDDVCKVVDKGEHAARLIAAAPDMLKALQSFIEHGDSPEARGAALTAVLKATRPSKQERAMLEIAERISKKQAEPRKA